MKQVGGFEIPLYKHAVKIFVGLPDDVPQQHAAHTDAFPDKQQDQTIRDCIKLKLK